MTTRTRRSRTAPALAAFALLGTVGLTACGGGDEEPGDGDTPAASGDATEATDEPSEGSTEAGPNTVSPELPEIPEVRGVGGEEPVGAVSDVTFDASSCGFEPGAQEVSGTLTNPTDDRAGYLISISWINATNDVLGQGFTVVRGARPGEETDWTVEADIIEGAVQCVPRVQRGKIARD